MVEIISKRDGPRREDVQIKRLIEQNRSTIVQLADQISGGGYSASRQPRQQPKAEGLIIHVGVSAATAAEATSPSVRVTMNGRVISKDQNTGRQLHHIGDVRNRDGKQIFVLATKQNGFFSPVDETVAGALAELDGAHLTATYSEDQLAAEIGAKLGID
ncbi:hypothetical protein EOA13_29500 [Mesorhizobium sp. M7A.F.Ca.US.011.01.1.1]|nr:hypothetical protein EOA19_32835 [Mesorhizobium sp. M7A.F.Ca.US.010.02.1.1]RUX24815.1 hypothetical protein EOA13_29500 [Mesorhizobium sp. M7A.F.Ca.US.011.01.1.1]